MSNHDGRRTISPETRVSVAILLAFISCALWLGRLEARVDASEKNQHRTDRDADAYTQTLQQIDRRLSRIEGALKIRGE